MNSKDYWAKREAEALKHRITDEAEYDKELKRIYSDMLAGCNKEINAFYGRYADKEGITLAEAKKRVKELDIKEYERKAAKYVKDKDFSQKANEEMRLYNATMKINRLEMIAGHDELEKFMSGILKGRTEDELKRQAGILGKTVKSNAQKAHAIVNASFHNADFSDRVWLYQDLMKADLSNLLTEGLIRGKNPRTLARELSEVFYGGDPKKDGGYLFCAERLMRTELARVQTEAQKQSFERNGFKEYEFIVNGGCCDICAGLSGKHFLVSKMMPGENAPPMHPFCRCSTAAYEDSKEYNAWLEYLNKGGTTAEWDKLSAAEKQAYIKSLTKSAKSSKIDLEKTDNANNSVVKGKDLSGLIDYTNSEFEHDIETAIHAQGFDGLPRVVKTQKEFDELTQADHFLGERTIRAENKETLDLYEYQLKNDYFYVNCGVGGAQYGQGMYCAADYSKGKITFKGFQHEIDTYTQGQQARTFWLTMDKSSKILTLPHGEKAAEYIWAKYRDNYLLKHSEGAEHEAVKAYIKANDAINAAYASRNYNSDMLDALYAEADTAKMGIRNELFKEATDNTMYYPTPDAKYRKVKDPGTLAAEMGYDAINAEGHGQTGSYTVVLNRTKLIIYGGADYEYGKQ